jgi:hypothetical protein
VPADRPIRTRHLMHNLIVELDDSPDGDADDASARCSYTVLEGDDPGAPVRILLVGRYEDTYARDDAGWYLTDRLFHVDLSSVAS